MNNNKKDYIMLSVGCRNLPNFTLVMKVSDIIKKKMKENSYSQAHVAREINTTPQNFGRLLKSDSFDLDYLKRLSEFFNHNFFDYVYKSDVNKIVTNADPKITIQIDLDTSLPKAELAKKVHDKIIEILK